MDIATVRELRGNLERELTALIVDFEIRTGMPVARIYRHDARMMQSRHPMTVGITVDVEFN